MSQVAMWIRDVAASAADGFDVFGWDIESHMGKRAAVYQLIQTALPAAFNNRVRSLDTETPDGPLTETPTTDRIIIGGGSGSSVDSPIADRNTLRIRGNFAYCERSPGIQDSENDWRRRSPNLESNAQNETARRRIRPDYSDEGIFTRESYSVRLNTGVFNRNGYNAPWLMGHSRYYDGSPKGHLEGTLRTGVGSFYIHTSGNGKTPCYMDYIILAFTDHLGVYGRSFATHAISLTG